jgi:hypothetical protein
MKQILKFWLLAILALCGSFSSCSEEVDEGVESIVGLWTYASLTADIKNPTYPEFEEQNKTSIGLASGILAGTTIEFKSEQTFFITIFGVEQSG